MATKPEEGLTRQRIDLSGLIISAATFRFTSRTEKRTAEALKVNIDQFGITSHVNAAIISPGDREPLFEPVYNARVVSAPESFGALRVHPIESWRAGLSTGRVIYIRLVEEN